MEHPNATTMDTSATDRNLIYAFVVVGVSSLFCNLLLFVIVIGKKELRKAEYMAFVINRALLDIVLSLASITLQPVGVLYWLEQPTYCTTAAFVSGSVGMSVFASEAVLALNRYTAVCKRPYYAKIFKKRNVWIMCVGVWVAGIMVVTPSVPADALGRAHGSLCTVKQAREYMMLIMCMAYSVFFTSNTIVLFCYFKIFISLRRHQRQATVDGQHSRLQEDKALLRYIGAVALAPILVQMPNGISTMLGLMTGSVPPIATFLCTVIYTCCPLVDSVLAFTMVRPIRKELVTCLKNMCTRKQVSPGGCHHCQCQMAAGMSQSNKGGNSLVVRSHH